MPSKKPRINFTLEPAIATVLFQLAEQEDTSVSNLVMELVMEALEKREDMSLSVLAKIRDIPQRKTIKHSDAWK
jgi:hypothetical protein